MITFESNYNFVCVGRVTEKERGDIEHYIYIGLLILIILIDHNLSLLIIFD